MTGIGVDAIHPSMWSRISEKGNQLHTDLFTLTWPAQIQTLIYFWFPRHRLESDPSDSRHQSCECGERMRKPILDQWMNSPDPGLMTGRATVVQPRWQHGNTWCRRKGKTTDQAWGRATAPLDMTKCFEQVRLWHVWRWRCHWGFPRALLRIIFLVFSFPRRVGLWGSVSQPVTPYAATIAGSVFSCAILHVLFIWTCDCLMSKWPPTAADEVRGPISRSATEE